MPANSGFSAATDLGLGDMLGQQQQAETEEEKRKRRLGLSQMANAGAAGQLFGYGQTGIAAMTGLGSVGR